MSAPDVDPGQAFKLVEVAISYEHDDPKLLAVLDQLIDALRHSPLDVDPTLDKVIEDLTDAVERASTASVNRRRWLCCIGLALARRFRQQADMADLDKAIEYFDTMEQLTPRDDPLRAKYLHMLCLVLHLRILRVRQPKDLERFIAVQREIIMLEPPEKVYELQALGNCGLALHQRYLRSHHVPDLDEAIDYLRRALDRGGKEDKSSAGDYYYCLGSALRDRFNEDEDMKFLDESISFLQHAAEHLHDGSARLGGLGLYYRLALALRARYDRRNQLEDLDTSIVCLRAAVAATADDHFARLVLYDKLAKSTFKRYQRTRQRADFDHTIATERLSIAWEDARPMFNKRYGPLLRLGMALSWRFEDFGDQADLHAAIPAIEQALVIAPDEGKPEVQSTLIAVLYMRYQRYGALPDLERAIAIGFKALMRMDKDDLHYPSTLTCLGNALHARFVHLDNFFDLMLSIACLRLVVAAVPDDAPNSHKAHALANLGIVLSAHQAGRDNLDDEAGSNLKEAIECLNRAVELTTNDPHAAEILINYAVVLRLHFESEECIDDLDRAITSARRALVLAPDHPRIANRMHILASLLGARYIHLHQPEDLEAAVRTFKESILLTPEDSPIKAKQLSGLGYMMRLVYEKSSESVDYHAAVDAYRKASEHLCSSPVTRQLAAFHWADMVALKDPSESLPAFEVVYRLLPQVIWLGQTIPHRHQMLPKFGYVTSMAVAACIRNNDLALAVEYFEQRCAVIWSQVVQLRAPYDDLEKEKPDLAKRLRDVSRALAAAGALFREDDIVRPNRLLVSPHHSSSSQQLTALALEYETLLEDVRKIEGFENFLLPLKLADLAEAAVHGPIVLVNVAPTQCDAIVLCRSTELVHIPLLRFSQQRAESITHIFGSSTHNFRHSTFVSSAEDGDSSTSITRALRILWTDVASPILDALQEKNLLVARSDGRKPRVTWLLTGGLAQLPLHAAGTYDDPIPVRLSDIIVSSYTPSITTLLDAQRRAPLADLFPKLLVVSQPNTPGEAPLPGIRREIVALKKHFPGKAMTIIEGAEGTVKEVLRTIDENKHAIVHFACHGIQDANIPMHSAFSLYDGRLTLNDTTAQSTTHGGIAFLSACQTATGDSLYADESAHLAAGMLAAAGYRSVVGTLWAILDNDGPIITDAFYASFLEGYKNGTPSVADALQEAVEGLKEQVGEREFTRWLPFVHFGA